MTLTSLASADAVERKRKALLVAIMAVSAILRVGASLYMGNTVEALPGIADQISYHALALRVLGGHGFSFGEPWWPATQAGAPTAHWSYAYTSFLAAVYWLARAAPLAARLIQAIVVGILQPYLAYRLGRRLFGPVPALVAAALTAIYVYFVYYAGALMTESFYITAVLGTLLLALEAGAPGKAGTATQRRSPWVAAALGLSLGVAVLLRQLILLVVPFLFAWIWIVGRRNFPARRVLGNLALSGSVLAACVLPFTFYNYARFHSFVLLNTNAGFAFYWANHPIHGTSFQSILSPESASYGELLPRELMGLDEASLDRELLARGVGFVTEDPLRYILLSVSRLADYFLFWPTADSSLLSNLSRVLSFGWLWPFMLYGAVLAFRRPMPALEKAASPAGLLMLFSLVYSGIHILSWSLIRYRLPVDAVLLVFAGLGVSAVLDNARHRLRSASGRFARTAHAGATKE
jgi:4-amino-4-deoxy-L-arabinose transferase-like glycosyltransferase